MSDVRRILRGFTYEIYQSLERMSHIDNCLQIFLARRWQ